MEENDHSPRFSEQIESNTLRNQIKRISGSIEEEISILDFVCEHRESGSKILKHGIRKIRVPLKGRGKRGGGRVVYFYQDDKSEYVLFLMIFSKNEQGNLTAEQEKDLIDYVEMFLKTRR
jgi:hypothetical protein